MSAAALAPAPPLPGLLHTYTTSPTALPLFESADLSSTKCLIFLPGLFDGWMTVPYLVTLRAALQAKGWSLAQPHLTSSYTGFGVGSLEGDADLVEHVVKYLRSIGKETVVVMGHSTGCQQTMQYLLSRERAPIDRAIIQAPASDRAAATDATLVERIAGWYATSSAAGTDKTDLCPPDVAKEFLVPAISVYRAWSLFCAGGDDDFFSADIPSSPSPTSAPHRPLSQTFGALPTRTPVLALFSGADECVPNAATVQPELDARWAAAASEGVYRGVVLDGANHNVKAAGPQQALVKEVLAFIGA